MTKQEKLIAKLEHYTNRLFELVEMCANVSHFIELYTNTFEEAPAQKLIDSYKQNVNSDNIEQDDSYSYEVYDESYESYDDDE
jgi:hypothetical protein